MQDSLKQVRTAHRTSCFRTVKYLQPPKSVYNRLKPLDVLTGRAIRYPRKPKASVIGSREEPISP
jgi:hypothetical protein